MPLPIPIYIYNFINIITCVKYNCPAMDFSLPMLFVKYRLRDTRPRCKGYTPPNGKRTTFRHSAGLWLKFQFIFEFSCRKSARVNWCGARVRKTFRRYLFAIFLPRASPWRSANYSPLSDYLIHFYIYPVCINLFFVKLKMYAAFQGVRRGNTRVIDPRGKFKSHTLQLRNRLMWIAINCSFTFNIEIIFFPECVLLLFIRNRHRWISRNNVSN